MIAKSPPLILKLHTWAKETQLQLTTSKMKIQILTRAKKEDLPVSLVGDPDPIAAMKTMFSILRGIKREMRGLRVCLDADRVQIAKNWRGNQVLQPTTRARKGFLDCLGVDREQIVEMEKTNSDHLLTKAVVQIQ